MTAGHMSEACPSEERQELLHVRAASPERREVAALGFPCLFHRDEQARIVVRLEQVAKEPRVIGELVRPTGFRRVSRLFQAEAEAERAVYRNRERSPPFADLHCELREVSCLSLDDAVFRPQGVQPGVVYAVKGRFAPTAARRGWRRVAACRAHQVVRQPGHELPERLGAGCLRRRGCIGPGDRSRRRGHPPRQSGKLFGIRAGNDGLPYCAGLIRFVPQARKELLPCHYRPCEA